MSRRKDGRPRVVTGVISSRDFLAGRPYVLTSTDCHKGKHTDCSGCPGCECHVPVRESLTSPV